MRTPKVKVTKTEIRDFPLKMLKLDDYYKDLLDYKNVSYSKSKIQKQS